PRTRPWFQYGLTQSQLAMSDVFFTKKGEPIAAAVQPIKNGVLSADIRLAELQKVVESIEILPNTISLIVDANGIVLASTAENINIQQQIGDADGFNQYMSTISSQESTFSELTVGDTERLVLSSQIKLIGGKKWYLINAVDKQIALAPVTQAIQQLLMSCVVIIGLSVVVLIIVINRIYRPVLELKSLVTLLSNGDGDLTQRLEVRTKDDLGDIATGINHFIESLNTMLLEVKGVTSQLIASVNHLRTSTHTNTEILSDHQAETNQVVVAMDELGTSSEMVAHNAGEAAKFIEEANHSGEQSRETIMTAQKGLELLSEEINGATAKVTQMNDETKDISSILSVIGEIAEQTNLLALNAAIEAARAGEQGRGFAVVADEVRALAGRTQLSTGEINKSLAQLQSGADSVVSSIDSTKATSDKTVNEAILIADSLEAITGYVAQINEVGTQISQSADEQNNVIQEISQNMNRIDNMVGKLSENGSAMAEGTDEIAQINERLRAIVGKFKLVE
ncbi:methyl-accepting chemotaxis protein, partial [Neiella marina]